MKKKLLITGFDPFGGEQVNPAFEAVRLLPDEIAGLELCKLEIPTEFIKSGVILKDALRAVHPNAVLCVGQAGGRTAVTPERVAINLMDARIPDNAGYQPIDTPVVPGWPRRVFFHAARQGNCSPDTKRRSARCGIQYRWYIRVQQPSVYAAAYGGARISRPARRLSPCALCRGAAFRQTGRHLRHAPARYRSRLDPRRRGDFRKPVRITK